LQAGIAACHCRARDYDATDWPQILSLYDRLLEFDPSPVVALNRAVALAEVTGTPAGIDAIRSIEDRESLDNYHLFHAVWGEFEYQLKHLPEAAGHFEKALALAAMKSEQAFLAARLAACQAALTPAL
jgi:RNA polymerase sigma-70 factor (ECF subfamily)